MQQLNSTGIRTPQVSSCFRKEFENPTSRKLLTTAPPTEFDDSMQLYMYSICLYIHIYDIYFNLNGYTLNHNKLIAINERNS